MCNAANILFSADYKKKWLYSPCWTLLLSHITVVCRSLPQGVYYTESVRRWSLVCGIPCGQQPHGSSHILSCWLPHTIAHILRAGAPTTPSYAQRANLLKESRWLYAYSARSLLNLCDCLEDLRSSFFAR